MQKKVHVVMLPGDTVPVRRAVVRQRMQIAGVRNDALEHVRPRSA
jgi:hypothetical protein